MFPLLSLSFLSKISIIPFAIKKVHTKGVNRNFIGKMLIFFTYLTHIKHSFYNIFTRQPKNKQICKNFRCYTKSKKKFNHTPAPYPAIPQNNNLQKSAAHKHPKSLDPIIRTKHFYPSQKHLSAKQLKKERKREREKEENAENINKKIISCVFCVWRSVSVGLIK
jgi:hypothetical protein